MNLRRALFLLIGALLLALPAQAGAQAGTGVIHVSVSFNGTPLANIGVFINQSADNPNPYNNFDGGNFTNAQGTYDRAVPPGRYDVHVGELAPNNNIHYGSLLMYEVEVTAGGNVNMPFGLDQEGGTITGTVRDSAGRAAPGVKVEAFGSWAAGDGPPYGWGDTITDANGAFTIPHLKHNGWYVVLVNALGYRMDRVPVSNHGVTPGVDLPNANYAGPVAPPPLPAPAIPKGSFPAGSVSSLGGDVPVVGDWDGNKTTTLGVRRGITFYLKNDNTGGFADVAVPLGNPDGVPLAGDWTGSGKSSLGVFQNATFFLSNTLTNNSADTAVQYGALGDVPLVGDWTGSGKTTIGVWRQGTFYLHTSNVPGPPDIVVSFGDPTDVPVVGDWDGNGTTTIGVWRKGVFYLKNTNAQAGDADMVVRFGDPTDVPVVGDWDGNKTTTVGVRRGNLFYLSNTNAPYAPTDGVAAYGETTTVG